jgi:tight adherence protein B
LTLIGAVLVAAGIFVTFVGVMRARTAGAGASDALVPPELAFSTGMPMTAAEAPAASPRRPLTPRQLLDGFLETFNSVLARASFASGLQEELARADLKLRASEFFFIQVGLAALLGLALFARAGIIAGLVAAVIGYILPGFWLRMRQSKRQKAFANQLGDTLLLLSNALKAGYSIAQAADTVAKGAGPPISIEFSRAVREMNLGLTVDDALRNMVRRVNSDDFDLVVTAIGIHRQVGGNLAEILDTIAFTIRERVRIKGEIRTLTAQARGSGYIVTALPFALSGLLFVISPNYFRPMLTDPLGWIMLGAGLTSMAIGYAIIRKMVAIEV